MYFLLSCKFSIQETPILCENKHSMGAAVAGMQKYVLKLQFYTQSCGLGLGLGLEGPGLGLEGPGLGLGLEGPGLGLEGPGLVNITEKESL